MSDLAHKMTQEEIDVVIFNHQSKGWVPVGCTSGIAFLSPCAGWIIYIDPETGGRCYFDRKLAEKQGFYVSVKERSGENNR